MARRDLRERLRNALLGVRVVRAFMGLAQAEAKRVGLWNDIPWLFSWLYRICWLLAAVAILFLPALPDEPFIYFPAILAVATAWLFTAPAYGQALLDADLSSLRPGPGLFTVIREALAQAGVMGDPPPTDEVEAKALAAAQHLVPHLVRQVVVGLFLDFKWTAYWVALVSIVGLLVGPRLQQVHLGNGWSPVTLLYAVSAPSTFALLLSLAIPMVTQQYVAALRLKKADNDPLDEPDEPNSP